MSDTTLVLLGAGSSSRFELPLKKQWLRSNQTPLWQQVAQHLENLYDFNEVLIVSTAQEIALMQHYANYNYVEGGNTRQASLNNALTKVTSAYVLISDIARCCIDEAMVIRILEAKKDAFCVVPTLSVVDTLYYENAPINRENAKRIQTPQLSHTATLKEALNTTNEFTDESSAIASLGKEIHFVEGSNKAHKLTTIEDLSRLSCLKAPSKQSLVGFGVDIHPFEEGKPMKLCGVTIDAPFGFKAHSDGDVAIHALIDALLGAAGFGDIGELFPDTDSSYSNADSYTLLKQVVTLLQACGFVIHNTDITIMAEIPKVSTYKMQMKEKLSTALGIDLQFINIKATTAEKLGFVGNKEGVKVYAVANIGYFDWQEATQNIQQNGKNT